MTLEGREVATDKEGYLTRLDDWSPAVAEALAAEAEIELGPEHWEIIELLREFYREFELAPSMRPLVKRVTQELGPDKGRSIYLMRLFPPSPARVACKIAGLPRPNNCF